MLQTSLFPTMEYFEYEGEDSNQWFTPDTPSQPVLTLVKTALGGVIGLDPTSDRSKRTPALRHITEAENCLIQQARNETIFSNPPFDNPLPFVEWVARQVESGNSPQAIMLCKSGVESNQGTGAIIKEFATATCKWHWNGRIKFIPGDGVLARLEREVREGKRKSLKAESADFDTTFINFGEWEGFSQVFDSYGHVQLCRRVWKTSKR